MSNSNQQTVQTYEDHVQDYIDGTPQSVDGILKNWLDKTLELTPPDARILELGSAMGRDATYLQQKGYTVECTDVTEGFVKLLQDKGFNARKLDAVTDDIAGPYDLILASAVLLHFTREETAQVLHKVYEALSDGGLFAFTLKEGEGEEWSNEKLGAPRFFCYWTADQIAEYLQDAGFEKIDITAGQGGSRNVSWVQIIAKK
jgi:predicted TPR repeat methyltransferase